MTDVLCVIEKGKTMSDHNGGRWINDEQYIAPYDVVMELNNIKTIAYHLGEDKRELLEANTKLVGAINLIRETLNGGEVQDLHQIINSALAAHAATTVTHNVPHNRQADGGTPLDCPR